RGVRPVRPDPSVRQADAPRSIVRDHTLAWLVRLFDRDRAQGLRQPLGASRLHVAARGVGGARFPRLRVFETARPAAGDRRLGAELRASYVGFAIVATLGFAANDSGIAIPGMMLSVFTPVIVV